MSDGAEAMMQNLNVWMWVLWLTRSWRRCLDRIVLVFSTNLKFPWATLNAVSEAIQEFISGGCIGLLGSWSGNCFRFLEEATRAQQAERLPSKIDDIRHTCSNTSAIKSLFARSLC